MCFSIRLIEPAKGGKVTHVSFPLKINFQYISLNCYQLYLTS